MWLSSSVKCTSTQVVLPTPVYRHHVLTQNGAVGAVAWLEACQEGDEHLALLVDLLLDPAGLADSGVSGEEQAEARHLLHQVGTVFAGGMTGIM